MVAKTTEAPRRMRSLGALKRSTSGNTMAMMGAAMIPLAAMTGSAIDMSRLYMAKVRLQQACDAGALAGRRFMTGATLDSSASAEAEKFFNVNFPADWMGTTEIDFTPVATADGQVHADATATVPMALMQMFGKQPVELEVECDARFEISNTDIMFVLDITGSMNCAAADSTSTCTNNGGVEKSNSRAAALRTAVVDFYDTINTAVDTSARLRLGFVPYSSGVNVGALIRAKNASYLSDTVNYQSRVANFTTPTHVGTSGAPIEVEVQTFSGGSITQANCAKYGQRVSFNNDNGDDYTGGSNPQNVSGGPPPTQTIDYTYSNDPSTSGDWGWSGASDSSGTYRSCRRTRTKHPTTYTTRYGFTNWTYKQEQYNTANYKTGAAVAVALGTPAASWSVPTSGDHNALELAALNEPSIPTTTVSWDGCVEERQTISQSTFSLPLPSTAYDLDIDLIPTSDATRWRPTFPDVIYKRPGTAASTPNPINNGTTSTSSISNTGNYFRPTTANTYYACPKAAQKLQEMTRAQVESYVAAANGFRPIGGTYHDFGLIWGARLISPTGIFADENAAAPNGKPIGRHIIFMTDGNMSPNRFIYGLYGMEFVDQRISNTANPQDDALRTLHNSRFSAICNAARAKNITIWVVAYAQTMTPELQACADPGKAFYASSDQALKDQFKQIAQQIAQLRLSQ